MASQLLKTGVQRSSDVSGGSPRSAATAPIKVLYDVSWLGDSWGKPAGTTGLGRAIETLAEHLNTSVECDLALCAGYSFRALGGYLTARRVTGQLAQIPIGYARVPALCQTPLQHLSVALDRVGRPTTLQRVARRLVHTFTQMVPHGGGPLDKKALARSQIYHSPFFPIPEGTRKERRLGKVLTVYDLIPILFPQLTADGAPELQQRILSSIKEGDVILCISGATKADLCNHLSWLDPDRVFVTYLAASAAFRPVRDRTVLEDIRKRYGIPDGPYVLTLSALQPRKGMEHVIKCFRQFIEETNNRELNLVIAGPRGWKFEGILSEASGCPDFARRVIVTGRIADEHLAGLYSGALLFVFSSLYEGFGLPVLEAMQCGTPVVASNTTSLPEVVGSAGILVPPRDPDALCQAILDLYESPERRRSFSSRGRERSQQFSWQKCAAETVAAYRVAIG